MLATDVDSAEIAKILVDAGADLNIQGERGCTALMRSCLMDSFTASRESAGVAKVLLGAGADPSIRAKVRITGEGGSSTGERTPLEIAERMGRTGIVALLEQRGAT